MRAGTGIMGHIDLAEAIEQLREELGQAQDAGANQQLQFEVDEVEVEFLVDIRKDASVGAKVRIAVVEVDADGRFGLGASHRLTFKLKAKDNATGGGSVELGREIPAPWSG